MAEAENGIQAAADPKPQARIQDPGLLRSLHLEWKECVICWSAGFSGSGENRGWIGLSLHHISKHPRDDVRANLVMLCGHGTAGCHGKIEAHDNAITRKLGSYIVSHRDDTIAYLYERFGVVAGKEFLRRNLMVES